MSCIIFHSHFNPFLSISCLFFFTNGLMSISSFQQSTHLAYYKQKILWNVIYKSLKITFKLKLCHSNSCGVLFVGHLGSLWKKTPCQSVVTTLHNILILPNKKNRNCNQNRWLTSFFIPPCNLTHVTYHTSYCPFLSFMGFFFVFFFRLCNVATEILKNSILILLFSTNENKRHEWHDVSFHPFFHFLSG